MKPELDKNGQPYIIPILTLPYIPNIDSEEDIRELEELHPQLRGLKPGDVE